MKTIKEKVENLLIKDSETGILCRNNDNFLIFAYIREYHNDLYIEFNGWTSNKELAYWSKRLPALSELKRLRAYFQNEKGLYLAETQTQEKRKANEEQKREEYKNKNE